MPASAISVTEEIAISSNEKPWLAILVQSSSLFESIWVLKIFSTDSFKTAKVGIEIIIVYGIFIKNLVTSNMKALARARKNILAVAAKS